MPNHFNVIIIGAGPAGYVAAIRLAQLGKKVLLIEKEITMGGTCLNVGCIPTKALLDSTEVYSLVKNHALDFGISTEKIEYDLKRIMERKLKIVSDRCAGIEFLIKKNNITRIQGKAKLSGENIVKVTREQPKTDEKFTADQIILATGSEPVELSSIPFNGKTVISSDQAISLNSVPESMIIIGAGAIGLELGSIWSRLGSKVRIIEILPSLLGGIDRQMAGSLQRSLAAKGIQFYLEHKVTSVKATEKNVKLTAENRNGEAFELNADILLVAAGRKPYIDGLDLENAGVEVLKNGRVKIEAGTYQTSKPGIYAIGDIIEGPMLAHRAEEEGVVVAELISGLKSHVNYHTIASIIYTSPEAAWVGQGEDQLKAAGMEYNVGRFLFRGNARAHALNETDGMVKILADKKSDQILGMMIIGPRASELIAEGALAMKYNATVEDIIHTVHAHPTLSEVIKEAALDVKRRAIHS